eukprot:8798_1
MPKKNKKKNRRQMEEDIDWDKSGSDEGELISTKDIVKKNKKKKKKNKKKQSQNTTPSNDLDASGDDQSSTKPVQKLSKKEQRRLKKMQKYQQQEDSPDPFAEDTPPPQANKRKGKKKGKKGKGQAHDDDNAEWNSSNQGKNKKKKQKKGKKNKQNEAAKREAQLEKLKEERQEALLALGNHLMGNLEVKYASYFGEDMKELWEAQMLEFVDFYEEDYKDKVEDEEILSAKKDEIRASWDEIFELIEQDYNDAQGQREAEKKERDRLKKLEELRAQGLNIGTAKQSQPSAAARKAQQKREEKEKLKALRSRLAEMDKLAVAKEKEEAAAKAKQRKVEEQRKRKEEEERRKKQEQIEAEQNEDWDDSSSDEEEEEVKPKKQTKGKTKANGSKTKAKDAFDSSDDEEWGDDKGKKRKKQQKKAQKKSDPFNESDDEQPQPQPQKKRGGRRRKKKGGGGQTPTNANAKEPVKKPVEKKVATPPPVEVEKEKKESDEEEQKKNKKGKKGKKGKKDKKKKDKNVKLRSPICVVMGHVDTGKTKILDHIRNTSVQNKEAGGITQQIGATYLSIDYIKERTSRLKEQVSKLKYKVPGLLLIDTPGHESFSNLRSRGSSMCDIAVLVVDLMHGLEPQTIESLNMLRQRKSPFLVALNKIDVCYDWKADADAPFLTTYNNQTKATQNDFENRLQQVKVEFAEQGVNAELYTKNKRMDRDISLVPTSAITGEGIPDLMYLIVQLTKKYMSSSIAFNANLTKASVLEVKQTQGYGATIDVIVSNGTLRSDDVIIVCGMNGPIVSPIRALLLPHEAQEMRVKGEYRTVREVSASVGVRIACVEDLQAAVAGAPLFIVPRNLKPAKFAQKRRDVIEDLKDEVQKSFADLFSKVDKGGRGVFVQASTLGSLEALITFLAEQKIPISGIGIGTIAKKTIMKAAVMLNFQPEYAVILAFNVKVAPDARILSQEQGVRIFEAEIIYHLQEMFENYIKQLREERKAAAKDVAVFPVEFKILSPEHIFNNKNPLVLGVNITRGTLRVNTPICAQRWNAKSIGTPIYLGRVDGIKADNKDVQIAKCGDKVSVRIMGDDTQKNVQVGRTFDVMDPLISEITRESIDALKANFKDEMTEDADTVQHLGALKKYFNII